MMRLLLILVCILGTCIVGSQWWEARQRAAYRQTGTVRLVATVPVEQVETLWLQQGNGPRWVYEKRGKHWRYPAYHNAYVHSDRIEFLLTTLAQGMGTMLLPGVAAAKHYGLESSQALKVGLQDGAGAALTELWIGRGIPGARAGEVYICQAGSDTVFHLHANPRSALDATQPPLLDRRLRPAALKRKALVDIRYERSGVGQVNGLRRVETAMALRPIPGQPPQGPSYVWIAQFGSREDTCLTANVQAYMGFFERLVYKALHAPFPEQQFSSIAGRLTLEDEEGTVDVLEMGNLTKEGAVYWRHRQTGLVFSLDEQSSHLLFPSRTALMDSMVTSTRAPTAVPPR